MLIASIVLFAIAALLGLTVLAKWLSRQEQVSRSVVYSHGATAVIGLVLLVIFVLQEGVSGFAFPLILFGLAAILGLYIFFRDEFHDDQNIAMAIGHAIMAVGGLMMLLFYFVAQ